MTERGDMRNIRIFISGTQHDLDEYREAVITQLRRMNVTEVAMDWFIGDERNAERSD